MGIVISMHRCFKRNPKLNYEYRHFMRDYVILGHMKCVPPAERDNIRACYLPHYALITKTANKIILRVVFYVSNKISNDRSFNDYLAPGPALKGKRISILLSSENIGLFIPSILSKYSGQYLQIKPNVIYKESFGLLALIFR